MKYSVVIPVYNSEKTIRRCLDSFLQQLSPNIEILIVNDGSTDKTAEICQEYTEKSLCYRYYEKKNGGVSSARNYGLEHVTGEYALFVDSDDYVSDDCFEFLDHLLAENEYDYIICSGVLVGRQSTKKNVICRSSNNLDDSLDIICECMCNKTINAPWAKVFKTSIIDKYYVRFPQDNELGEDRVFNISYAIHSKSVAVCDKAIYFVSTENQDSLSRRKRDKEQLETFYRKSNEMVLSAIHAADLSIQNRQKLINAMNFGYYCDIYSETKRMILEHSRKRAIYRFIASQCNLVLESYPMRPMNRFCMVIYFPVRFKLYGVIYFIGKKLANGSTI